MSSCSFKIAVAVIVTATVGAIPELQKRRSDKCYDSGICAVPETTPAELAESRRASECYDNGICVKPEKDPVELAGSRRASECYDNGVCMMPQKNPLEG